MGAAASGERGNRLTEVVLGMVAVGTADHVLGGSQHASHIVDGYTQLQEHGCASVAQDVRRDFSAETRQIPSSPPSTSFLRGYRFSGPFDDIPGGKPAPAP